MGVIIVGVTVVLAFVQIIMAMVAGIKIWRSSSHQIGARRTALRLLAFNLIEPTTSAVLIVGLLFLGSQTFWSFGLMNWRGVPSAFMLTLPMVALLLPFAWAASSDPVARSVNIKLGILGLVRWTVTALTFVMPFVMILGLLVLGFSIRWVKRQAYQAIGAHYQAIGLGAEGVMVGELHDFSPHNQPTIRL